MEVRCLFWMSIVVECWLFYVSVFWLVMQAHTFAELSNSHHCRTILYVLENRTKLHQLLTQSQHRPYRMWLNSLLYFAKSFTISFLQFEVIVFLFNPYPWKQSFVVETIAPLIEENNKTSSEKGEKLPDNLHLTQCPECGLKKKDICVDLGELSLWTYCFRRILLYF